MAVQLIFTDAVLARVAEVVQRSPELARRMATPEDLAFVRDRGATSLDSFAAACERYADRECFSSSIGAITYRELWRRVTALASGWLRAGIVARGDRVGICGSPGIDWVVADLACLATGAVSVPLAVALPPAELRALVEHARLTAIVCGAAQVPAVAVAGRTIVVMRNHPDDVSAGELHAPVRLVDIAELEAAPLGELEPITGDPLVTIMYTSGSTGLPKGVMLTERRWRAHLHTSLGWPPFPHISIGYLPHAQIAGRRLVLESLMHGGLTHFAAQALPFDDIRAVRPTLVPLVPRVSKVLFQEYQAELVKRGPSREAEILAEMRTTSLGDRLCVVRVGSGSTPPDVVAFLQRCFAVPVADGYGATETGSLTLNGMLFPHIEYKLVDVPELGYAYPRGELLVRSPENTTGYLDDPEATAALFDADGFLKTGDIVEERAPRQLVWLDRRSSVTKLAQGQFVATSRLEEQYATGSPFIAQIYLYANPRKAFLLAVIVPDRQALRARGITDDDGVRRVLREEIMRVATETDRRSHEVPRDFLVETEPFTIDNQLLTESGKPSQRALRDRYGARLEQLHEVIEARQVATTHSLADTGSDIAARVRKALAIVLGLGVDAIESAPQVGFVGFGGDSIAAVRFCVLVEEAFGVRLPVASVLDPSAGVAAIVERVIQGASATAYESVHRGETVTVAEVAALTPSEPASRTPVARPPATVLLTGATGFLGRFLVGELARRARVICLVRGGDDRVALERMRRALAVGRDDLAARFDQLCAEHRVVVRAGDLVRHDFGLAPADYAALCEQVDAVVHGAALVNHVLAYRHLFEPNLLGTREVFRLAARRPQITLNFVSSLGVANTGRLVDESARASELWPVRAVDGGPGIGYVTSKWAGEVLVEELHRRHDITANILRSSNIAPHPEHVGHLNWADNTNRLLYSILATRIAPASFYDGAPAPYELLPMDAVARTMAAIATGESRGLSIYHLSSGHALSLDTLVDWIASSGIALRRLPHAAWFAACSAELEQLPAARRARSCLPIIARWQAPIPTERIGRVTATAFRQLALRELGREPAVDEALVHRWVRALAAS